jgi:hypothetical protein
MIVAIGDVSGMETPANNVEQLKERANGLRALAEGCEEERYAELMRKGARHLEEQAQSLASQRERDAYCNDETDF